MPDDKPVGEMPHVRIANAIEEICREAGLSYHETLTESANGIATLLAVNMGGEQPVSAVFPKLGIFVHQVSVGILGIHAYQAQLDAAAQVNGEESEPEEETD